MKNNSKVFSLDSHPSFSSMRPLAKSTNFPKKSATLQLQKVANAEKTLKSPAVTQSKMLSLVRSIKLIEKGGIKETSPVHIKLDS